jgi:peptide/nickel transport system substrate-binding protein
MRYNEADAKLWELGHSIPVYQRPQIFAVREGLANYGASGMGDEPLNKTGWLK